MVTTIVLHQCYHFTNTTRTVIALVFSVFVFGIIYVKWQGEYFASLRPFSNSDLSTSEQNGLQRNRNKRRPWGVATEGWRKGNIKGGCVVTYDRSKLRDAYAVIFHYSSLDLEKMPWKYYRDPDQLFVYVNIESPNFIRWFENRKDMNKFDGGFINVTATYRSDSNLFFPYICNPNMDTIVKEGKHWVDEHLSKKSRIALWVVSNCDLLYGSVQRMNYVNEMVKSGLDVHKYGGCFNNKEEYGSLSRDTLLSYKFYLSFENGLHCKDYLTEKFWCNGIAQGRVPVVWGPAKDDVTRLAPPKSFIHTEDFDSPASLVAYLLYLDKNDTAYREYFKWIEKPDKRSNEIAKVYSNYFEQKLCALVKQKQKYHNIVESITDYYKSESIQCFLPK